ncbi:MAG: alcohol dehydrogenase catalytic domain-containing protein [Gemmatimonas sp.]|nr:alcohol dehydrogenase catalytic domain-containing protein [Gemmatimonas sp.]
MQSAQLTEFGKPLVLNEIRGPEPQGREVLLETVACGVCHSDLHMADGYYDLGGGRRTYLKAAGMSLPRTLGHEVVGRVLAVGPTAEGAEAGEVRLVYPWIGCGECKECGRGASHLCGRSRAIGVFTDGGYSDHVLVPDPRFLLEIGDLRPEIACSYACAGLTAFSALRKITPLDPDDGLLIIGAGGLGLMALQLVRELTDTRVIVVDSDARKLEAAARFGNWSLIDASNRSAFAQIRTLTRRAGVAAVVDFVGSGETARLGYGSLARNGTLVVVGLYGGQLVVPTPALPLKNVTIRGSYTGSLSELRYLVSIVRAGQLRPLPAKTFPLDSAQEVLDRLRSGDIVGRAVLRPTSTPATPPAKQ